MGSIDDISQLCRLCLVKDQVNIPIFDGTSDIGQTFIKIESCLPVKVSRNDNLPKKICDGCSYKLDMLYTFRNTSIDSEKQLIQWLNQAGLSTISQTTTVKDPLASTTKPEIMVKQENFDTTDSRVDGDNPDLVDPQSFMIQQDHLGYEQEFVDFGEASGSNANDDSLTDEPAPKRAKRAAALKKAPLDDETEDDLDAAMQITKAEEEDEEEVDQPEYVEAPSTSADDQPGPSGVGKATTEAPIKNDPEELLKYITGKICPICNKTCDTPSKLRIHVTKHSNVRAFPCPTCSKAFKTETILRRHIQVVHEKISEFCCDLCDYQTTTKTTLQNHVISHHDKNYPFRCDECGKGFIKRYELVGHTYTAHQGERYTCETCQKSFKVKKNWKSHIKRHDPLYVQVTYSCNICEYETTENYLYQRHIKKHTLSVEACNCEVCGKVLKKTYLEEHMRIHSGKKPHVCKVCGKAFRRTKFLTEHVRIHTGEKPFTCQVCAKSFAQKSGLTFHMRYHTGEKPFTCEICSKGFVSRTLLKTHQRKVHKEN